MRRSTMLLSQALSCRLRSRGRMPEELVTTEARQKRRGVARYHSMPSPRSFPQEGSVQSSLATLLCLGSDPPNAD